MEPLQVLVVDMNVGFSQRGNLFSPRVADLVEPTVDFLQNLPDGSMVAFISDCHEEGDPELRRFPLHCMKGTGEELVRPELIAACKRPNIVYDIIYKTEYDAFIGSAGELEDLIDPSIHRYDKNGWIVVGCVTDICVESNVGALAMRGKNVTVVRNLIDTYDLPLETCRELGLPESAAHNADEINRFWFEHRFPTVWGARVVEDWMELAGEPTGETA